MKTREAITSALMLISLATLPACSDARQEQAAKENERKRLEAEQQAQAEAAKANKAITTNNQKMFSRMNASGPGSKTSPDASQPATESPPPKKE